MMKVSPESARDSNLYRCLGDGSGTEHVQRLSHLGMRTVAKLANIMAARVGRSVMVLVFSRAPAKPCSKTIVRMVLVAVVALPRSVAASRHSVAWAAPGFHRTPPWQAPCRLSSPAFTLVVSWPVGMLAGSGHQNSPRSVNYVLLAATDIPD